MVCFDCDLRVSQWPFPPLGGLIRVALQENEGGAPGLQVETREMAPL